jgi:hypothetical protein
MDGWVRFSSYFLVYFVSFGRCARVYFGELMSSMSIHFLELFFGWMDGLHLLRFELAAGRGRDFFTGVLPPTFLFFTCIGLEFGIAA